MTQSEYNKRYEKRENSTRKKASAIVLLSVAMMTVRNHMAFDIIRRT